MRTWNAIDPSYGVPGLGRILIVLAVAAGFELAEAQPTTPTLSPRPRVVNVGTIQGAKTVIRQGTMVRRVDPIAEDALLRPDELIVARWAAADGETAPTAPGSTKAWSAGFGFIGITREGHEVRFRPIIETVGGLLIAGNASGFRGRIFVGLRDNRDPSAAYSLPLPVSLLVASEADEVAPRQLTMDHTNLPFVEVAVGAQDPPDTVGFSLIAAGTSERASVRLPVIRPRIELSLARSRIQGLGLETAAVTVRAVGLPSPEGRVVAVTSDFASVDPTKVVLDAQGTALTTVRSVSLGEAVINASSPPLAGARERIAFSWPFALLLASILGGIAGAALATVQRSGLPKRRTLVKVAVRGTLTGLIVVALYAIGVNVLPIKPLATAGEVLAFAVAAVGGFVGLKL